MVCCPAEIKEIRERASELKEFPPFLLFLWDLIYCRHDLLSRRNKGNKGKMTSKEISAISAISAGLKKLQA